MIVDKEVLEKLDNIIDIIPNIIDPIDQVVRRYEPYTLEYYSGTAYQIYDAYLYLKDSLCKYFKRIIKLKDIIQNNSLHGTIENEIFFERRLNDIYIILSGISLKKLADPTSYDLNFYGQEESDTKKLTRALNIIETITWTMSDDDE